MNPDFGTPLWLTLQLATITTLILLVIGVPLAYWIAYASSRWRAVVETFVSMPLVLPPSVLGFYLLLAFGQTSWLGSQLQDWFGIQLVFTFGGLVVGSVLFSLPFMVQPIQTGFRHLPRSLREAAYTLGKSPLQTLFLVLLPNIKRALLTGVVMSFAHTIGEFGVVLMIGGNIPGVTRVVSLAIYDEVEALNYPTAHAYALILLVMTFGGLLVLHGWQRQQRT